MATYTVTYRPKYVGAVGSYTSYSNVPYITDSDVNTYMADSNADTRIHRVCLNYDLSSIPSEATITDVSVSFTYIASSLTTSDTKLIWMKIKSWSTSPTASSVGVVSSRESFASSNGVTFAETSTKKTLTWTGQQIQNNSRNFINDINGFYKNDFRSNSIAIETSVKKYSSNANVYYYDCPITITYTIPTSTITVNAGTGGTATGGGEYPNGTQVTITATPNTNYRFVQWSDGNTSATRTITVNGDATYTASFALIQYTITTSVSPSGSGSVSGGGTYDVGSTITLTATPSTGYTFSTWQDGVRTASRSITVQSSVTYTATFTKIEYSVQSNLTNCSLSNSSVVAEHGSTYTTNVTPVSGYEIDSVTVTMGGTNITSSVYSNGVISIASVTGNIVITATASVPTPLVFQSVSFNPNPVYASQGCIVTVVMG